MSGTVLGLVAFAFSVSAGILWFQRMNRVAIPANRSAFLAVMWVGLTLGVLALARGAGWIGGAAAVLSIFAAALFTLTVLIGGQKGGSGALQVGQPIPDFTAPDENGEPFQLSSLAGRPVLMKFFRGHW